jgi:signal transduction histidine kinase
MLDALVRLIEHQTPSMRCSILLMDRDGVTLRHGAAPSLPKHYREAIDGLKIGPHVGSCGTAAFHRQTTIVSDIARDPLWKEFRGLALPIGLRACWSTPILSSTGEVLGTFAMYYDEVRSPTPADEQQIRTAATLAAAVIERDQANRAKNDFLATMSHELRTPLNAIGGYADLLLGGVRGELAPAQKADIERMKRSGEHLLSLINDILNFAKLEAGRVEVELHDFPVRPLISTLEDIVRPQLDARTISFVHRVPDKDVAVRADDEKLRQVLLNLVTNAVKFTAPGGRVEVACEDCEDGVRISVHDTGRGIPEDQLPRIFDPFVQIDRDRTPISQQGVGLGLSISRDLATAMGGSLTASSVVGQGSTFTLTLPRAARVMPTIERTEEPTTLQA